MDDKRWHQLLADMEGDNVELMVEACESLYRNAEDTDVPRLLELLKHKDFVVREAAAWPLAEVGSSKVLPELFTAYQLGFDEGLDNDGFTTALIELVTLNPTQSRQKLLELADSANPGFQKYSRWLLEFC